MIFCLQCSQRRLFGSRGQDLFPLVFRDVDMSHAVLNSCLFAALVSALVACGSDTDRLEPEVTDGAPTYEQLNPPVPPSEESSMAPATPDSGPTAP